jgi:glioma pathogenesis-related protein 2
MKKILILVALASLASLDADSTNAFQSSIVERHNALRAKHGAAALTWSPTVASVAQNWASKIARDDQMRHRQPNKYGENIYWISGGNPTGTSVTDTWYGEIKDYNYARPGFGMKTGHFTQVVWKSTKEIGCGVAKSRRGGTYVVCNYNPPGNYSGRFPANVLKPK